MNINDFHIIYDAPKGSNVSSVCVFMVAEARRQRKDLEFMFNQTIVKVPWDASGTPDDEVAKEIYKKWLSLRE